jgi:hypothetical protein
MGSLLHLAQELSMTLLRQLVIEDMQVRNLAPRTQATYILHVSLFARIFVNRRNYWVRKKYLIISCT